MFACGGNKKYICNDFNLTHSKWVNDSYKKFYEKHGYLPEFLDVYNSLEITDYTCTQSTRSNVAMGNGTILILETKEVH